MSSGTPLQAIRRPLADTFSNSSRVQDLPSRLVQTIEELVGKHPTVDDASSLTLQDDLLRIHKSRVAEDEAKYAGFLHALLLLRPWLTGKGQKLHWWRTSIFPVLNDVGRLRVEIERASEFMVAVLVYDNTEGEEGAKAKESRYFLNLILTAYFERTAWSSLEGGAYTWENEHCAAQFEQILIAFSRKRPKSMMLALGPHILNPKRRAQALGLLAIVVQHQPAHIHSVLETPIIEYLLQCLTLDASTITVQFATTALVMFLPHIPSAVKKQLPRLFHVYSRLVCWDKVTKLLPEETSGETAVTPSDKSPTIQHEQSLVSPESANHGWQKVYCTAEGEDVIPVDTNHLFTFLYGLYPLNFTSFLRQPRKYLEQVDFDNVGSTALDEQLIRERTAPLRDMHRLHPNFYNYTIEEELETDRWLTSESSEIVGECVGLCIDPPRSYDEPGPPPTAKLPPIPATKHDAKVNMPSKSLLQGDDASSTASTHDNTHPANDQYKDSNATQGERSVDKMGWEIEVRGRSPGASSVTRRGTSKKAQPDSPLFPTQDAADKSNGKSNLDRSLIRLDFLRVRSELSYERFLRQQQSAHLGHLQRRHISDATMTANYENITNLNKTLTSRLNKTNEAHTALKKEAATKRQQHKAYELELSTKVRSYRAMERQWSTDREELMADKNRLTRDNEALKVLVTTAESKELQSKQSVDAMGFDLTRAQKAQDRVKELEEEIKDLKHKNWDQEKGATQFDGLKHEMEATKLKLESTRADYRRMVEGYDKTIAEMIIRVRENEFWEDKPQVKALVERFNKQKETLAQLRADYRSIRHENIEMEIRLQEYDDPQAVANAGSGLDRTKSRPLDVSTSSHHSNSGDDAALTPRNITSNFSHRRPSRPPPANTSSARSSAAAPGGIEGVSLGGAASAPTRHGPPFPTGTLGANLSNANMLGETGSASGFESDVSGAGSFYKNKSSAFSADSLDSAHTGGSGKTKVSTKSEKRMFGRGGSQNIGKTDGGVEVEEKKKVRRKAPPKTGGIRGIRGLM